MAVAGAFYLVVIKSLGDLMEQRKKKKMREDGNEDYGGDSYQG